jgi:hypothetical protein
MRVTLLRELPFNAGKIRLCASHQARSSADVSSCGELPEGASVTVALEGDETFEADPETETMLLDAMAQCRQGQVTRLRDFLGEMRSREC